MSSAQKLSEVRIGTVKAVVFANPLPSGDTVFSTTVSKLFKDSFGKWTEGSAFNRDELLLLAEAVRCAFHLVVTEQQRQSSHEQAQPQGEP